MVMIRFALSVFTIGVIGLVTSSTAQHGTGYLRGRVTDEFDSLILSATVTLIDEAGIERKSTTASDGAYQFSGLVPGKYRLRASAPGFAQYRRESVTILAGRQRLEIRLKITLTRARVIVPTGKGLNIEPEANADAVLLQSAELSAFPDDRDSLLSALNALVGPVAGQDDREVIVDGFSSKRLPPKQLIQEIRIGQNPYSAEFERMGQSRIEISTKPGTGILRGGVFFNFNDQRLNSRNPFASNHTPFQLRHYGANFSGPLASKRASMFLSTEWREADENAVINATFLNDSLVPVVVRQSVLTPQRSFKISPRIDYQLAPKNNLSVRYSWTQDVADNEGIGGFSLPERAYRATRSEHIVQLTESAVVSRHLLLETRFQFSWQQLIHFGDNSQPTIRVLDAFTGGGSQVGDSYNHRHSWEVHEHALWARGEHSVKFGGRIRRVEVKDVATANFGGTYIFAGGSAVMLDDNRRVIMSGGSAVFVSITSLERYRRTLLFLKHGLPDNRGDLTTSQLGFGPSQFSMAGGNPRAQVSQWDESMYIQDDWRFKPNFVMNLGLRLESQSNTKSGPDLAPRAGFAWAIDGAESTAKTVIRGGFGFFYQRFSETYTLQQKRFNGENQQQFVVLDPRILSLFPGVPSVEDLTGYAIPQTERRVAEDIRSPLTVQSSISIERQLPNNFNFTLSYLGNSSRHVLRTRNINAPLPGTYLIGVTGSGVRPFEGGNIFQYESSGRAVQHQLRSTLNSRLNKNLSFQASYVWTKARSDTDGATTFPANSYDLESEYARSINDITHHFSLSGTFTAPWNMRISPFIVATSGRPFNIITGRDSNGDTLFAERPAFASAATKPRDLVKTAWGSFDTNPALNQPLIPRNHGNGPPFFLLNLRGSRTFRLGEGATGNNRSTKKKTNNSGHWLFAGNYSLTLSVQIQNLLNTTNPGPPIGNLRSTYFGLSNSLARGYGFGNSPSAANRRIELQLQLNF
jgi:hypothetical protein